MNGRFASALDRPSGFCYRYSQGRKAEPCFPAGFDLIVLRSFGVYTEFGIDPDLWLWFLPTEIIPRTIYLPSRIKSDFVNSSNIVPYLVWLILGVTSLAVLPAQFLLFPPMNTQPISRYIGFYYIIIILSMLFGNFPAPLMGYGISPIIGYYLSLIWYQNRKLGDAVSSRICSDSSDAENADPS